MATRVTEGGDLSRIHRRLDVAGSLHIETPAGAIELSGRGSSLVIDMQRPATFRGLARQAWSARGMMPRLARLLEFAGLELELRVANRSVASLGARPPQAMSARWLKLRELSISPGAFLRALLT